MNFILKILVSTLAVLLTAYLLGVYIDNVITALMVALVLAFLNSVLKPLMILLSLPVTIFTFGLFLLVINSIIILIASRIVHGFHIQGFWTAMGFSIVLSLITSVLDRIRKKEQSN
ncbi:MAG TPA: phage holin family protein [Bacteroidia bacterium]|jgi:putative membrane protein|nr:phage holin family protein [Bacteroidia bacterium]